jgi:hypothetical protein
MVHGAARLSWACSCASAALLGVTAHSSLAILGWKERCTDTQAFVLCAGAQAFVLCFTTVAWVSLHQGQRLCLRACQEVWQSLPGPECAEAGTGPGGVAVEGSRQWCG